MAQSEFKQLRITGPGPQHESYQKHHLKNKWKARNARARDIERDNHALFVRMVNIIKRPPMFKNFSPEK